MRVLTVGTFSLTDARTCGLRDFPMRRGDVANRLIGHSLLCKFCGPALTHPRVHAALFAAFQLGGSAIFWESQCGVGFRGYVDEASEEGLGLGQHERLEHTPAHRVDLATQLVVRQELADLLVWEGASRRVSPKGSPAVAAVAAAPISS